MKKVGQIAYFMLTLAIIGLAIWLISQISLTALYIILAILILLVMVTIHELGHYLAGKALKFKINEFAIGFGPKLFSIKRKNGEIFSIRLFPLGGFCAFEGENEYDKVEDVKEIHPFEEINDSPKKDSHNDQASNTQSQALTAADSTQKSPKASSACINNSSSVENSELKRFSDQAPWKRIIVLFSGGLFNLISAVFFSFLFILIVGYEQPKVYEVYAYIDQPTVYYNQLQKDDIIMAIDGKELGIMTSYTDLLSAYELGDEVVFTVLREGEVKDLVLVKQEIELLDEEGKRYTFEGFGFTRELNFQSASFGYAVRYAVPFTAKLAYSILGAFGGLFTGRVPLTQLSGPVGTVGAIAEYSQMNWRNIFLLLPLIAANLGLFNLFPIPALDGSKILFTVVEWIRKKPINRNVEAYIHLVGMVLLLLFVIVIDLISFL